MSLINYLYLFIKNSKAIFEKRHNDNAPSNVIHNILIAAKNQDPTYIRDINVFPEFSFTLRYDAQIEALLSIPFKNRQLLMDSSGGYIKLKKSEYLSVDHRAVNYAVLAKDFENSVGRWLLVSFF